MHQNIIVHFFLNYNFFLPHHHPWPGTAAVRVWKQPVWCRLGGCAMSSSSDSTGSRESASTDSDKSTGSDSESESTVEEAIFWKTQEVFNFGFWRQNYAKFWLFWAGELWCRNKRWRCRYQSNHWNPSEGWPMLVWVDAVLSSVKHVWPFSGFGHAMAFGAGWFERIIFLASEQCFNIDEGDFFFDIDECSVAQNMFWISVALKWRIRFYGQTFSDCPSAKYAWMIHILAWALLPGPYTHSTSSCAALGLVFHGKKVALTKQWTWLPQNAFSLETLRWDWRWISRKCAHRHIMRLRCKLQKSLDLNSFMLQVRTCRRCFGRSCEAIRSSPSTCNQAADHVWNAAWIGHVYRPQSLFQSLIGWHYLFVCVVCFVVVRQSHLHSDAMKHGALADTQVVRDRYGELLFERYVELFTTTPDAFKMMAPCYACGKKDIEIEGKCEVCAQCCKKMTIADAVQKDSFYFFVGGMLDTNGICSSEISEWRSKQHQSLDHGNSWKHLCRSFNIWTFSCIRFDSRILLMCSVFNDVLDFWGAKGWVLDF